MHTSIRHYSLSVERDAASQRASRVHANVRRSPRPSLRDRIHATLRPGRSVPIGATA